MESSATDITGPGSSKESGSLTVQLPVSNPFVQGNAALLSILNSGTPASPTGTLRVTALLAPFGNRVETLNLKVVKVLADQNLILVKGSVPGAISSYVIIEG